MSKTSETLISAAQQLRRSVNRMRFSGEVSFVYNPLDYAWDAHEQYLKRYATGPRRVMLLGMNPGPFGMMQTGVPFGEVAAVRDWIGISTGVKTPKRFHPKRPIQGFDCPRSEVSGRRLWGWAASEFGTADKFLKHTYIANYCPLVFLAESGRNVTPDKLVAAEHNPLQAACDKHLKVVVETLNPEWLIGIGAYAAKRLSIVFNLPVHTSAETLKDAETGKRMRVGQVLHPSPASPLANKGWDEAAKKTFAALGVFP